MFNVFVILGIAFLLVLSSFFTQFESASANVGKNFSDPENLGTPVESVAIYDSTYGKENGRDMMYTTASGEPAIFQVVDLASQEVLRTYELEGSGSSWTHITVPNGNVYIGGNGTLYEYSPDTQEVKNLGGIGESVVYGLSYDEEGRVYFGSYPNAKAGRYDPSTGEMTDYGSVAPGQNYTRSTAYHDGYLYLGVGVDNHVVKLDVDTGDYEKIDIPENITPGSSIWQMDAAGKYIVAGVGGGSNALLFYDTELEEWSDTYYLNNKGLRLVKGQADSDKVYFLQGSRLKEIDLETLEATDTGVTFGTFLRNTGWVEVPNDPDFPGLSLVTVQFGGGVTYMNLETKKVKTIQYPIVGNPIPLQTLEKGPDDSLYMSGYPGGKAAVYHTDTGESKSFSLGQAEGMAAIGDYMYFGVYPGASIFELDTTEETISPKKIYEVPDQDRPFVMTPVDEKLYIGTIPDYGHLGGSLTILDPKSVEDARVYDNVVENQSITGLAEKDGKLYGSTTIYGGLGIDPTETEAKIFVWDIEKGEKIEEFVPTLPKATTQPRMISGMSVGPDGLLWSAADGTIFAMDPNTLEIVKSENIYPDVENRGRWRPVHIRWSEDGIMYTTLAGKVTAVDPKTMEYETLNTSSTELMTLGDDGNLYYAAGTNLMKITVADKVTLETVLDVINGHEEEGNMKHSLSKVLSNKVKQALHHSEKDRLDQAKKHVQDALKHLEKAKEKDITEEANLEMKDLLQSVEY